jgi:PIN domain nuclease of toxin-antitoxin system
VRGYLLDTSIVLIGLTVPERIAPAVRRRVERGPVFLSVISYWEIVLKSRKGKLDVGDPRAWWIEALDKLGATPLPLRPDHISEICQLEPIHQDPFDRALIAQATVEQMVLVTSDSDILRYASARFQVVS